MDSIHEHVGEHAVPREPLEPFYKIAQPAADVVARILTNAIPSHQFARVRLSIPTGSIDPAEVNPNTAP